MSTSSSLLPRVPKYVRIAESLKEDMARGVFSPDDQLPSFTEMTQRFQVAKHTIDKAHAILERDGLVRREQGRGIFVEHQKKKSRTDNIGLLLPGTTHHDSYSRELIAGIQQQARTNGVDVMLADGNAPITTKNIDGILLFCNNYEVVALDLPARMPRVLLLSPAGGLNIANVVADDFGGTKMATTHLLKLGHRRISFMLAAEDDTYSLQRLAGYRAALDEFGVNFDERLCFFIDKRTAECSLPTNYFLSGEENMNRWLARGWRKLQATAILAPNDARAFGMMKALGAKGLNVPQDVSVVGFDGVGIGARGASPLTTVQVPLRAIGACSAKLLWKQIQKGGHFAKQIVLPVQLKIGQSTAPV
jgi:DNA-binding LacI/PurR family transcriptional regulator